MNITDELKKLISGEVKTDDKTKERYSRDTSIFKVRPSVVVAPRDTEDIKKLVSFVSEKKKEHPELSLTARSAGTDMGGGPLSDSIVVSFTEHINQIKGIENNHATVEPGMYYRDFEKATLEKGLIFPSFPASRELCAMGGIVNNNAGGEESIKYGKTENFVTGLKVVLADGKEYDIRPLNKKELEEKKQEDSFEGNLYKNLFLLLDINYERIKQAKPKVRKNSAGYALWNVWDRNTGIFDLTKLFVGAQGTLGFVTEATIKLVRPKKYSRMLVIFLKDINPLAETVADILPFQPEEFESYDDHTLKLALKYFPSFAKHLGTKSVISLFFQFLPELFMVLRGGLPKLVLQAEFTSDNEAELDATIERARAALQPLNLSMRVVRTEQGIKKYHTIRRESFNLLRNKIKGKHAAPFIDDFVVRPEKLSSFLPELNAILQTYNLTYTIAGHIGSGNFHIIPLMDLSKSSERDIIPELSQKVYDLVLKYEGSITGEHNDGLIRSYYLPKMFGIEVYKLFEETKRIFDPQNIFNPRKKVYSDWQFSMDHIITTN